MTKVAPEVWRRAVAIRLRHDNESSAAAEAGLPRLTFRYHLSLARIAEPGCLDEAVSRFPGGNARRMAETGETASPPLPDAAMPPDGFVITEHNSSYDAAGELSGQTIKTRRENGEVYRIPEGLALSGESAFVDKDHRLIGKWVKSSKESNATASLVEALRSAFAEFKDAAPFISAPPATNDELLTVYPMPDLHLGMYSWGKETGSDYDVPIAVAAAQSGIGELVERAPPTRRAVLLGLGDYFHGNDFDQRHADQQAPAGRRRPVGHGLSGRRQAGDRHGVDHRREARRGRGCHPPWQP